MSAVSATDPTTGNTWDWTLPSTTPPKGTVTSPDGAASLAAAAGGAMGKDEFVKLLVAQMKNQDPLNPMDGKELAAQLAQFSSVEQLVNMNNKLDDLTAAVKANGHTGTSSTTGS